MKALSIALTIALVVASGVGGFITPPKEYFKIAVDIVRLIILCAFPSISLWLPSLID